MECNQKEEQTTSLILARMIMDSLSKTRTMTMMMSSLLINSQKKKKPHADQTHFNYFCMHQEKRRQTPTADAAAADNNSDNNDADDNDGRRKKNDNNDGCYVRGSRSIHSRAEQILGPRLFSHPTGISPLRISYLYTKAFNLNSKVPWISILSSFYKLSGYL